jgi:hypothetical protein
MAVDGSGRVRLLGGVQLLHPEQQTFDDMLDGWRNQQLSRNLKFDTIDQRIRYVRRFVDHVNEFSWHWTPAHVEEYFGDLRSIRHLSHSTLRAHQSALRHFTSYVSPAVLAQRQNSGTEGATNTPTLDRQGCQ